MHEIEDEEHICERYTETKERVFIRRFDLTVGALFLLFLLIAITLGN